LLAEAQEAATLSLSLHSYEQFLTQSIERWFAQITRKRIRRGSFNSVQELEKAIYEYLAACNKAPKPFIRGPANEGLADDDTGPPGPSFSLLITRQGDWKGSGRMLSKGG
jgi:hypothetical protein